MKQKAKRVKYESQLDAFLCPMFPPESHWIMFYFCIALDCTSPILEVILFNAIAITGVVKMENNGEHFERLFIDFLCEKINVLFGRESRQLTDRIPVWEPVTGPERIKLTNWKYYYDNGGTMQISRNIMLLFYVKIDLKLVERHLQLVWNEQGPSFLLVNSCLIRWGELFATLDDQIRHLTECAH
jgi:hypothetical protein